MTKQIEKTPDLEVSDTQNITQNQHEVNYDIDGFLQKRQEFITKVNTIMVEKQDYHIIKQKKSLAKGGAEKIASIFGWTATFERDKDAMEAFSEVKGIICFVCNLHKDDKLVGQGRGSAILSKNDNDPNKTLKMAQKSAFIDAVLRASGLSDFFTQDLEDMPVEEIQNNYTKQSSPPMSEKQKETIHKIIDQIGLDKEGTLEIMRHLRINPKDINIVEASRIIKELTNPSVFTREQMRKSEERQEFQKISDTIPL